MLPFAISTLYWVKIQHKIPLPDLHDDMTIEDVQYIYKSNDIEKIRIKSYTKSKHA